MFKKISQPFLAFLQTSGLVLYIILISTFFSFVTPSFNQKTNPLFPPIIMLLLFVMSAVISATLILGRAAVLFWDKKYKESFTLIAYTAGWGLFYLALFLILFYFADFCK